jgi:predicted dehydrogenase
MKGVIVGAGNVADLHMRAWATIPDVEIACVVDVDEGRACALARRFGVAETAVRLSDAMSAGLRFVDICTPPSAHEEAVAIAGAAGAHVLIEKPLADSPEGARRIQATGSSEGILIVPVHQMNHVEVMRRLRRLLDDGTIGHPGSVIVQWHNTPQDSFTRDPTSWAHRHPGGRLFEALPHPMYILYGIGGAFEVKAAARTHVEIPWMETDNLAISVEGKRFVGAVSIGTTAAQTTFKVVVFGTEAVATADLTAHTLIIQRAGERDGRKVNFDAALGSMKQAAHLTGDSAFNAVRVLRGRWRTGHERLLAEFARAMRDGSRPPVSIQEGVAAVEATHEALRLTGAPSSRA